MTKSQSHLQTNIFINIKFLIEVFEILIKVRRDILDIIYYHHYHLNYCIVIVNKFISNYLYISKPLYLLQFYILYSICHKNVIKIWISILNLKMNFDVIQYQGLNIRLISRCLLCIWNLITSVIKPYKIRLNSACLSFICSHKNRS